MTGRPLSIFVSHPSPFLTDSLPHGDGLIAHSILRRLADRGHTLHVAVPLSALEKAIPGDVRLYPLETMVPPKRHHPGLTYRVEYAIKVRRLFSELSKHTRIDLIHQMNPVVGGLSLFLYGRGCPLIMGPIWPSSKGYGNRPTDGSNLKARFKDNLLTPLFFRVDGILSPTPASADRIPASIRRSDRAFPFPLGIDVEQFSPDSSACPSGPTVLFLANMQERKGVFVLLSAFERVLERIPTARLLLAGDGEHASEVRKRVEQSPHRESIRLSGQISRENIARTLQACSVYCLPSFGEPYGMGALEAMACGKPVVVTNAGGLGHLVPDQGSLKVPPCNVSALADALTAILQDEALQKKMGLYNRNYVLTHHSWDHVIANLEEIYCELIQRSSSENLHLVRTPERLAL
jgi:L-malate glycosyltransferase